MSLADLQAILPPPPKPKDVGSEAAWTAAEAALGIAYPLDFKEFIATYGSCTIGGAITLINPMSVEWSGAPSSATLPRIARPAAGVAQSLRQSAGHLALRDGVDARRVRRLRLGRIARTAPVDAGAAMAPTAWTLSLGTGGFWAGSAVVDGKCSRGVAGRAGRSDRGTACVREGHDGTACRLAHAYDSSCRGCQRQGSRCFAGRHVRPEWCDGEHRRARQHCPTAFHAETPGPCGMARLSSNTSSWPQAPQRPIGPGIRRRGPRRLPVQGRHLSTPPSACRA